MGIAESRPTIKEAVPTRTLLVRQRVKAEGKADAMERPVSILDEKATIQLDGRPKILTSGSGESISTHHTEQYVLNLLRVPKNRLALSSLSTNNPSLVLEKPAVILRDSQVFNLAIQHEGSPVTNQRSSGRWAHQAG